jgi:hypothetical protein
MRITAIVASLLLTIVAADSPKPAAAPMETRVDITPSSQDAYMLLKRSTPFTYTCTADVLAPQEPGKVRSSLARAKVAVEPGHSETSIVKGNGVDIQFTTKIDKNAERADWSLSVTRDGELVTRQTSTVWLQKSSRYWGDGQH